MIVRCVMCGEDVDADALGTFRKVTGWESRRASGGTNALRMRQPLHEYAHRTCVDAAARGRKGQSSLAI